MHVKAKRILTLILSLTLLIPAMTPVSSAMAEEADPLSESDTDVSVILDDADIMETDELETLSAMAAPRPGSNITELILFEFDTPENEEPTEETMDETDTPSDLQDEINNDLADCGTTDDYTEDLQDEFVPDTPEQDADSYDLTENVPSDPENDLAETIPSDEPEIPSEPDDGRADESNTVEGEITGDDIPGDEATEPATDEEPENIPSEDPEEIIEETIESEETEEPEEEAEDEITSPHQAGDFVLVTTNTGAFTAVDATAAADRDANALFVGSFLRDAVVQIENVLTDEFGSFWYKVRYLYGDSLANGNLKWTAYGIAYVPASETIDTDADSCTVTDYALTMEQVRMRGTRSTRNRLMAFSASSMDGFSLKNISVNLGSFKVWQDSLNGSSGKDSDYPQLAKSTSHGTIYATPHYLEGFTVFCLEHTLDGPGEGSGSNQAPKGPYVLVDMDTFCNTSTGDGVSGVRYSEKTMHALAWVLRHTYPFMVLDRSDGNNEVWSRVAGQFAMREVIKELEGSRYVRSYWDMDNFYSFSGGAPSVYLTYARWLASNGIARSKITGKITAANASLSVSGTNFIGTVTLTTDADLIRIPKAVGTLTGNSGGSDNSYYYAKSGDTIKVTSTQRKFTVTMESISSASEEANFLVGIPEKSIQKVMVPTYGTPYPLKEASVTFELKLGDIEVTKKSSDGILLKNTVFELLSGTTVVKTGTTNASGVVKFTDLEPGTYTVREKTAPQGYKLAATSSQNVTVVAGATAKAEFSNQRITGKIRIVKTDSQTKKALSGATFTVTRLSGPESDNASDIGKVVATITTNAQGIAETGVLPWGEYKITETGVPDGYIDSGYVETVWIK